MITATLVDRMPVDLHIFRNYPSPSNILEQQPPTSPWPDPEPAPLQKLWEAARATGAAPTYFKWVINSLRGEHKLCELSESQDISPGGREGFPKIYSYF